MLIGIRTLCWVKQFLEVFTSTSHLTASLSALRVAIPILYGCAAGIHIIAFLARVAASGRWARIFVVTGIVLQGAVLGMLSLRHGHFPFTTVFEGLFFCSLLLAILYLGLSGSEEDAGYGAFLWPVNFIISTLAVIFLDRGVPFPTALVSTWFYAHASVLFVAYACFFFSFVVSCMYLLQHHQIRTRALGRFFRKLPPLQRMGRSIMRADVIGLGLLILGMALGIRWMDVIALPPTARMGAKMILAISTAIIYSAEHLLRIGKGWQGVRTCLLSISGFLMVIATLMAGRHGF